jgi:pyrroloquinoline quinone biosynthesis protein D
VSDDSLRYARGVRLHTEGESVAYLLVPEGVVDLNESARAVLELVDGTRNADDIAAVLSERYEAPIEELRSDVRDLCEAFRQRGFLR